MLCSHACLAPCAASPAKPLLPQMMQLPSPAVHGHLVNGDIRRAARTPSLLACSSTSQAGGHHHHVAPFVLQRYCWFGPHRKAPRAPSRPAGPGRHGAVKRVYTAYTQHTPQGSHICQQCIPAKRRCSVAPHGQKHAPDTGRHVSGLRTGAPGAPHSRAAPPRCPAAS